MATIYGIQLKAVKKTMGLEGEGFVSNLYMDGKKIGTACDYVDDSYNTAGLFWKILPFLFALKHKSCPHPLQSFRDRSRSE